MSNRDKNTKPVRVVTFKKQKAWQLYVNQYMSKAKVLKIDYCIEIRTSTELIAKWSKLDKKGFINERRPITRLWKILLHNSSKA